MSNEVVMDRCAPNIFLFYDGSYYFCPNQAGSEYFKVGDLGSFSEEAFGTWLDAHPAAQSLLAKRSPIALVRECYDQFCACDQSVISEILNTPHQFGISNREGCGVCRSILEAGLFDTMDEMLAGGKLDYPRIDVATFKKAPRQRKEKRQATERSEGDGSS